MKRDNICRVLIVDDEVLTRLGLRSLVNWEQEGFQIVGEASNGREALEQMEALRPHIVLTDIVMPIMTGEEFTRIAKSRFPDIEIIVLSSFGEFEYVRSTFQSGVADYILKPKLDAESLLGVLRKTAGKIPSLQLLEPDIDFKLPRSQLLQHLINGYHTNSDMAELKEAFPHDGFCLLGADVRRMTAKDSAIDWIEMKLQAELELRFETAGYERVPIESEYTIAYMINAPLLRLDEVKQAARSLLLQANKEAVDIGWLIGDSFASLDELAEQYRNRFIKLADYRFYMSSANTLVYSELPNIASSKLKFDMGRFTEELKREHFDDIFQYLNEYVQVMTEHYTTDIFEFKSFLSNIIFNVTTMLSNLGYHVSDLEEEKYTCFKQIDEAKYAEEAVLVLNTFLAEVEPRLAARQESANPNMRRLLEYIQDHYAEPLSLTGVAEHFHFNASYLSSYFMAHNKEGFSEYLNKIRVEKAIDLLRQNAASISEISGMVGYSDHSYFTKVFKKQTGLSPSLYRKQFGTNDREWL